MSTLRIHLFGTFQIYHDASLEAIRVIPNVQTLLSLLLVERGRIFSRDAIIGLLWGERTEEQAHSCLNTALWRLRTVIESGEIPRGTYLLCRSNNEIGFNWESDHWLDIHEFQNRARQIVEVPHEDLSEESAGLIREILPLYRGDFMENCQGNWVLGERERLRGLYLRCLVYMMNYSKFHGKYEQAIDYAERILEIDPLREEIHRELMRMYTQTGQRPGAMKQYEICRTRLMTELGILPMAETRNLHSQIVTESPIAPESPDYLAQGDQALSPRPKISASVETNTPSPIDLQLAFNHTTSAMSKLEETRRDIQNIYHLLQSLLPHP